MIYLIQVTAYTGFMYLVYLLFLKNKPMHRFNRVYLLVTVLLPVIIPFIKIPEIFYRQAPVVAVLGLELPEYVVSTSQQASVNNVFNMVWVVYAIVALALLTTEVFRWIKLKSVINKGVKTTYSGYTIVQNTGYGPGSWMQYVLLPENTVDEAIISHELVHVQQKHSYDIVVMNIMQVMFWPNIFLYRIKKEIVQVHEFLADKNVSMDAENYSKLLLSSVFNTCTLPMTHSFIIHPIKRRIMMLRKNKKKTPLLAGVAAVIIAIFMVFNFISLQSCKQKTWEAERTEQEGKSIPAKVSEDGVYKYAEKMPEFDGDFSRYMMSHLKYPEDMQAQKIEGKVFVQFVVDETGAVRNPKVLTVNVTGPERNSTEVQVSGNSLSEAALAVVRDMPDWLPGEEKGKKVPVSLTLPIQFKLK